MMNSYFVSPLSAPNRSPEAMPTAPAPSEGCASCCGVKDAAHSQPSKASEECLGLSRDHLFSEFTPLVQRLLRQYGQDPDLRQDLRGEIYCRFCALLDAYDPKRGIPLRPYLVRQLTASVYTYARHYRQVRKREVTFDYGEYCLAPSTLEDPTSTWIQALSQQQVVESLPAAIALLPLRQRQVVIWRYFEERSFEEIAGLLNVQSATARSLLRHGLNNLRSQIVPVNCE